MFFLFTGGLGLEPRYSGPKPDVLPLDDPPKVSLTPSSLAAFYNNAPCGMPHICPRGAQYTEAPEVFYDKLNELRQHYGKQIASPHLPHNRHRASYL